MGFVVLFKCRKPDPVKVRAMEELQPHKTKGDVIRVLGLVVFYHEFIKNMSGLTALIQKLMEKNVLFEWRTEQQKASETLKNRISEKSCLTFPELDWYYELDKDVSLNGIGAVLFQRTLLSGCLQSNLQEKSYLKLKRNKLFHILNIVQLCWD